MFPINRADAEIFFGRGREIRELVELITAADSPLLVPLYGQSGVGKSSLLAAGLQPRLEDRYVVYYLRRDHGQGLLGTITAGWMLRRGTIWPPPDTTWKPSTTGRCSSFSTRSKRSTRRPMRCSLTSWQTDRSGWRGCETEPAAASD